MFLQKYIFYGYEASVRAFISLIFSKTSGKLCLPLCHKSPQEKGQEIRESIELPIESYILITQFYAVFYIGIYLSFQQVVIYLSFEQFIHIPIHLLYVQR